MSALPKNLKEKLQQRKKQNALRQLGEQGNRVDFSSNDYLGLANSRTIFNATHHYLIENNTLQNGATGSRLLSGNSKLYSVLETLLSTFHNSESALVFNSGYDANLGFFSSVPQRGDVILYDEYSHASIRDGIKLSYAKAFKFAHNNVEDLEKKLVRAQKNSSTIYVVTESVFSMDGDSPNLIAFVDLCETFNAKLIVDEAHAVGVFGDRGVGFIQSLNLEHRIFARLVTFGKALGCHGAAMLGSQELIDYLVNFSRSFIYTTALPPHSLATIICTYRHITSTLGDEDSLLKNLQQNILFFGTEIVRFQLENLFTKSDSAIQCCTISGNDKTKRIAKKLYDNGFDVRPILSPTVPEGSERLRFCLHSNNSKEDITKVLKLLATFV